jgi:pyrroline-5-carboxylate reductase
MASQTYRLGFIGAGKLAGSVIRGLIRAGFCSPNEILIHEPNEQTRTALFDEAEVEAAASNAELATASEVVLIAVKPGVVLNVVREIAEKIGNKPVISLAAGVRLAAMESVAEARFMRALTNTPSAICRAATAIAAGERTTKDDLVLVRKIFAAIGVVVEIDEKQMDVVTALGGSAPAFIYKIIESLAEGGEKMGLKKDVALALATQATLGAAQLMSESKKSPEELIKMVATPGGTTAAGLAVMEKLGISEGLIAAIEAATKRSQEMASENT